MLPKLSEPHIKCDLKAVPDVPIFDCGPPRDVANRLGVVAEKLTRFVKEAEERGYVAVRVGLHLIAADGKDIVEALDASILVLSQRTGIPVPDPYDHPALRPLTPEAQAFIDAMRDEQAKRAAETVWYNASEEDQKIIRELLVEVERTKDDEDQEAHDSAIAALEEIARNEPFSGKVKVLVRKNEWTEADQRASHAEGWDIFQRSDTGKLELNRLDEVDNVWEEEGNEGEYPGPRHENDKAAAEYVQKKADEGDARCRKAIEILIDGRSPDVREFNLNDAAWTKRDADGMIEYEITPDTTFQQVMGAVQIDPRAAAKADFGVDPVRDYAEQVIAEEREAHLKVAMESADAAYEAATEKPKMSIDEFNAYVDDEIATSGTFTMDLPDGRTLHIEAEPDDRPEKYTAWFKGHDSMEHLGATPYEVYSDAVGQPVDDDAAGD